MPGAGFITRYIAKLPESISLPSVSPSSGGAYLEISNRALSAIRG